MRQSGFFDRIANRAVNVTRGHQQADGQADPDAHAFHLEGEAKQQCDGSTHQPVGRAGQPHRTTGVFQSAQAHRGGDLDAVHQLESRGNQQKAHR